MALSWHSSLTEFKNASISSILEYLELLADPLRFSARVVRISESIVMKRRLISIEREYENLRFVWNLCERNILRVPEPIRHFQSLDEDGCPFGYVLMEHLPGLNIEALLTNGTAYSPEDLSKKVFEAVCHLQLKSRNALSIPGPPNGGFAKGFPWGEYGTDTEFTSLQHLQDYLQQRLGRWGGTSAFRSLINHELVLCHLDLVPRNILITQDNVVGILDWETLALYPSIFEVAALSYAKTVVDPEELPFTQALERRLKELSVMENDGNDDFIVKLGLVQAKSIRYAFGHVI